MQAVPNILSFIIPVRHQENARNWQVVKCHLQHTAASIAAQDHIGWRAVVVANHGADLPDLPAGFSVKRVDFPPNRFPHPLARADRALSARATRLDKGRRILAGMLHAEAMGHVMIVDNDDFVHRGLTSFVAANPGANGWHVEHGFIWTEGSRLLYRYDRMFMVCGSTHIIRGDLYRLPASLAAADENYLLDILGSHVCRSEIFAKAGTPLAALPFRGVVYRVGHDESWSHSRGVWRWQFLTKATLKNPLELTRRALRLRLKTRAMEAAYFGLPG